MWIGHCSFILSSYLTLPQYLKCYILMINCNSCLCVTLWKSTWFKLQALKATTRDINVWSFIKIVLYFLFSFSWNENVLTDFNKDTKYENLSNPFWCGSRFLRGQMQQKKATTRVSYMVWDSSINDSRHATNSFFNRNQNVTNSFNNEAFPVFLFLKSC